MTIVRMIFVANDGTSCWLFANRGHMQFEEIGETAGVARDGQGRAFAGMGAAAGDVDGDALGAICWLQTFSVVRPSRLGAKRGPIE